MINRVLVGIEKTLLILISLSLIVVVGLQVLSRYALGNYVSLDWTDELARSLMPWLTFIGAALLERNRENIQVTIVTDLLGPHQKTIVTFLSDILSASFLGLVLYSTIGTLRADQGSTLVTLPIPLMAVSASLALGTALMLFHVLVHIVVQLGAWTGFARTPTDAARH